VLTAVVDPHAIETADAGAATPEGLKLSIGSEERSLRAAVVFTAATSLQRAIMFLLLPIFTHVLDPAAYGQLSIALAIYSVAVILFAVGLDVPILRTYVALADEPRRQQHFVRSIWTLLLVAPLAIAVVLIIPSYALLDDQAFVTPLQMVLTLFGAALYVAATTVPLAVLRAERRLRAYILVNVTAAVSTSALTVAIVAGADGGVSGWLVAVAVANLLTLLVALRVLAFRPPSGGLDREAVFESLGFSIPLLPHTLAQWALQLADRLALSAIVAVSAVGIYGLASNLAIPLMVIVLSLNHALQPRFAAAGKDAALIASMPDLIRVQVALVAVLTLAFALLAGPAINLIVADSYAGALDLTPWIVLGYGFLGLYCVPMNLAALTVGTTKRIWLIAPTAAAVNLGLIFLFVPDDGLIAAAIASAAGYAVLLLGAYAYAEFNGNPAPYPWGTILGVALVSFASFMLGTELIGDASIGDAVMRLLWLLASGAAVLALAGPRRLKSLW